MKIKPNIPKLPFNNRTAFKTLVNSIIEDTSLYPNPVDQIVIYDDILTLVLWDKKFLFEEMKIDRPKDYTDVYLQGVKISSNYYEIGVNDNNIIITFAEKLVPFQNNLTVDDFLIKGKIVSI